MTERITLVNQGASAVLLPQRGGLLASLKLMSGGSARELLWAPADLAMPGSGWPGGGMPLMFPFAGRVFLAGEPFKYAMGGATYAMPLHGFAYGLPWQVRDQSAAACTLSITQTPGTTPIYPYEFAVDARYELSATALAATVTVRHVRPLPGAPASMPVALGWHPYFCVSSLDAAIATSARQEMQVTPAGAAGKAHPASPSPWQATLAEPKSNNLILGDLADTKATLTDGGVVVRLDATPASLWQQWVLWRGSDAYQCVEPWMGLPDAVNSGAGLKELAAGESFSGAFTIALG